MNQGLKGEQMKSRGCKSTG